MLTLLLFLGVVVAIGVALRALWTAQGPPEAVPVEERLGALEEQVRGLLYRVWQLEGGTRAAPETSPAPPEPAPAAPEPRVPPLPAAPPLETVPPPSLEAAAPPAAPARPVDLEQRIGARWATWVGIVAILFAVAFFLKWSFEANLLGPGARVALGLVAGLALLGAGLGLHRRRDLPYLSEGLAGGGLAILYLSLWAAHALWGLLGPGGAFGAMFAVTLLGALVSVASSRQITAVLTVLGGLLTPVLLRVEEADERNLLAYLLVLDVLVLAVARFRTWPALNRLAWAGTALLFAATLLGRPAAPHPLTRLALLTALFALFLAVPLLRERALRRRLREIDLVLVVANAAGYFWAVYLTLEGWQPAAEGPWALALAVAYRLVSADCAARVPEDRGTVMVHEGVAWTFLTLVFPLALDGRWVTLAWAVQGAALLWAARGLLTPVAAWGGLLALGLAAARVVALDPYWSPAAAPVWNLTYLIHLLVVVALGLGGVLAAGLRAERLRGLTPEALRSACWVLAALVLAVLFWREPAGLWPAGLLSAEIVVLGWLGRWSLSPAFVVATPAVGAILLARVLGADDALARRAAEALVSAPLLSRVAACAALGVAGGWLARSPALPAAAAVGRACAGAAGLVLLFVLSVNWTRYQNVALRQASGARQFALAGQIRWQAQVGLSVLWTLYAALALGWGFLRARPAVRYAALALLGFTVVKVFLVDLAAVKTAYRILSFLILGVVLLLVGVLYQKARRTAG